MATASRASLPVLLWCLASCILAVGCRTADVGETPPVRLPARFSAPTPWTGVTHPTLGLIVDSDPHPLMRNYATQLSAGIASEIQLVSASTTIVPYTDFAALAPMLVAAHDAAMGPSAAPMDGPLDNLPSTLPDVLAEPLNSNRLLVVQLLHVRPYVPMAATLRLTVIDTQTRARIAETTAIWDAAQPAANCGNPNCKTHHLHGRLPDCEPSPLQNSPDAMLKLISQQVAVWYSSTLPQPVFIEYDVETNETTFLN
jgi:hypothetical protein